MCDWGNTVDLNVTVPAHLSYTGEVRQAVKSIDACLAPLVKALNDGGVIYFPIAAQRHYFCSCGGALTAEEYIEHYFEKGHDRGESVRAATPPYVHRNSQLRCSSNSVDLHCLSLIESQLKNDAG